MPGKHPTCSGPNIGYFCLDHTQQHGGGGGGAQGAWLEFQAHAKYMLDHMNHLAIVLTNTLMRHTRGHVYLKGYLGLLSGWGERVWALLTFLCSVPSSSVSFRGVEGAVQEKAQPAGLGGAGRGRAGRKEAVTKLQALRPSHSLPLWLLAAHAGQSRS